MCRLCQLTQNLSWTTWQGTLLLSNSSGVWSTEVISPFYIQFEPEHFSFQILPLLLIKLKNFYYTFPGYLASVDSYMNLQVLIWQFGCHTIRVVVYWILFKWIANHLLGTERHTKFIAAFFSTACSLPTPRSTFMVNSIETWERSDQVMFLVPFFQAYVK